MLKRSLASFALCSFAALAACSDGGTIVELTVIDTVPVAFDAMQGGVTKGAVVDLTDLRSEPRYADVVTRLKCGTLDKATSSITIDALDVGAGATALSYDVGVAPLGSDTFTPLLAFAGSVADGDTVFLDSAKVRLDAAGLAELSRIVLSPIPAVRLQITGTVPGNLDDLAVSLSLAVAFSSDPKACPR